MAPDPDDDILAEQLFEAARRERPDAAAKRQALQALAAPKPSLVKQRWLLAALALGAVGVLFLLDQSARVPEAELDAIRAEPVQLPSRAVEVAPVTGKAARAREKIAPAPLTAPPANSAEPLRRPAPKVVPATLEQELELLDAARQALLAGDTGAALSRLRDYDRAATRRQLGAEAAVLRIQILAASGRASEASRLASEFIAKYPNSPLVDRAKSFVQASAVGTVNQGVDP